MDFHCPEIGVCLLVVSHLFTRCVVNFQSIILTQLLFDGVHITHLHILVDFQRKSQTVSVLSVAGLFLGTDEIAHVALQILGLDSLIVKLDRHLSGRQGVLVLVDRSANVNVGDQRLLLQLLNFSSLGGVK